MDWNCSYTLSVTDPVLSLYQTQGPGTIDQQLNQHTNFSFFSEVRQNRIPDARNPPHDPRFAQEILQGHPIQSDARDTGYVRAGRGHGVRLYDLEEKGILVIERD